MEGFTDFIAVGLILLQAAVSPDSDFLLARNLLAADVGKSLRNV